MTSLVVTDLDGTLWNNDRVVPAPTRLALSELDRSGIPVLAATARRSSVVRHAFDANGIDIAAVVLNGALGRDRTSWDLFYSNPFDVGALDTVLSAFSDFAIVPNAYLEREDNEVATGLSPSSAPSYLSWAGDSLKSYSDLVSVCHSCPVYLFSVVGYADLPGCLDEIALRLRAAGVPCVVSPDKLHGGMTLDVLPVGISKWAGVLRFCERHRLDPNDVLVVGDGDNDVELFENARISCAMHDSTSKILDLAAVRLPDGEGGWSGMLQYV